MTLVSKVKEVNVISKTTGEVGLYLLETWRLVKFTLKKTQEGNNILSLLKPHVFPSLLHRFLCILSYLGSNVIFIIWTPCSVSNAVASLYRLLRSD